jgi:glycosyltransferase involved in cell wall biosynthesis
MTVPASPFALAAIIFSKDRPLQLDAALRTWQRHCRDVGSVSVKVLYKASTPLLLSLYQRVMQEHPGVDFVPEEDFRRDLLMLLRDLDYVLFVVDDTVFVQDFTLAGIANLLHRHPEVLGFSLRLGRNTTYCYTKNHAQQLPDFEPCENGSLKYHWAGADHDFGYPLEVSSSVFRSKEMLLLLDQLGFTNPNTLEYGMAHSTERFRESQPFLACWEQSRAFSIPANQVQQFWDNRTTGNAAYSAEALAAQFAEGQRIATKAFDGFIPEACHQEVELKMVPLLISVVIPCYQQAQYLEECVASVAAQTFLGWELIIVNDGSPDDTSAVARELIKKYAGLRIRLVEKPNGGLSDARNAGIGAAAGAYFLPLDADDKIAPTFLSKAAAVLDSQAKVGFVYSHIQHFGRQRDVYPLPDFDADTMVHKDNVGSVCSLVRRTAWEQAGGYNVNMKEGYEDWDFWVGCIQADWQGWRIPEPLFLYRKREGSMLTTTVDKRQRLIARIVLNHPGLYSARRIRRAELEWEGKSSAAKPTRVLLACTHFWPSIGGLETIIDNLGVRLVRRGLEVTVATLSHNDRHFGLHRGMEIINLDPGKIKEKKNYPGFHPQLRKLAESGQYDACIFFADPLNWVFGSVEGVEVPPSTRLIAQPIINADGYTRWKDNRKFRQRLKSNLSKFQNILSLSSDGNEVKFLREENLPFSYLPNAVDAGRGDTSAFRQRFKIPEGRPILLHVANLYRVKNHVGLMCALRLLPGDWQLVMIGHLTEDREFIQQVRAAVALDPRFLLIPGLPHEEIASAMAAADVVLLASHGEVSPVCIMEAMSQGKPWVATPSCGAVLDNAGGLVAPLVKFPQILQKLITHPSLTQRLGRLGWEHWQACFSWERVAAGWEQIILTGKTSDSFEMPVSIRNAMTAIKLELDDVAGPASGPKVSVIVPTYNRPDRLEETLRSVLGQTMQDFEIIVVNDCGVDVSPVIARLNSQAEIFYHQHPVNRGLSAARNTALRHARGQYIAFLDDDDIFLPDHLETLVNFLESSGNKAAYTDAWVAEEEKIADGTYQIVRRHVPFSDEWHNDRVLVHNFAPPLCFMHERGLGNLTGEFDEELTTHEDWDYWIRLSRLCRPVHIKKITCEYRSRNDGTSMTSGRQADFLRTTLLIYKKHEVHTGGKKSTYRRQKRVLRKMERKLGLRPKTFFGAMLRRIFQRKQK